jgi:uncharacterized protein YbbC (DUF1343 family)
MDRYIPLLEGKKIALVVNHTSRIGDSHLVDTLLSQGIELSGIIRVFVPEHGLRGNFDAGEEVESGTDARTGIPVVSLYGNRKKPLPEELEGIDMVVFDIQDVGVRFYTYISTLHYVMEACAENGVPLMVLDRPNPNGGYVDGPVLEAGFTSFVGMHPIPVVYGLTIGELAGMINGEGWLAGGLPCDLTVVPCLNYYHGKHNSLPVQPSPSLVNDHAILLYPSTCFFEGTVISEGRGTPMPFEVYGHPDLEGSFSFTPVSVPGASLNPKFRGELCHGEDLRDFIPEDGWTRLYLGFLMDAYRKYPGKKEFFTPYFEMLAGTKDLRLQIEAGWNESQIRENWRAGLDRYLEMRKKYLLYK